MHGQEFVLFKIYFTFCSDCSLFNKGTMSYGAKMTMPVFSYQGQWIITGNDLLPGMVFATNRFSLANR